MQQRPPFAFVFATAAALLFLSLLLPSSAIARPFYAAQWTAAYPSSNSLANVLSGTGTTCQLCHAGAGGGAAWNGYGWAIRGEIFGGASSFAVAIANIEALNSDANPGGESNLVEISASVQPGWTPGPNNTYYFSSGATTPGQDPPAAILGDLDPPAPVSGLGGLGQLVLALSGALGGLAAIRRRSHSSS